MSEESPKQKPDQQEFDSELLNIIEAALFAAHEPLGVRKLQNLFPKEAQPSKVDIQNVILRLQSNCEQRGIELVRVGKGWRFQSKEKYSSWMRKLSPQKPPRYSRALLETLAIIAYRQPVTRGDIEDIRGVAVSSDILHKLEEREWIKQVGHRDVPGRPALFATSQVFLEYFNMQSLRELPELMEKRELGDIAKEMNLTLPMDGVKQEEETNIEPDTSNVVALHPSDKRQNEGTEGEEVEGKATEGADMDAVSQQSQDDANAVDTEEQKLDEPSGTSSDTDHENDE